MVISHFPFSLLPPESIHSLVFNSISYLAVRVMLVHRSIKFLNIGLPYDSFNNLNACRKIGLIYKQNELIEKY